MGLRYRFPQFARDTIGSASPAAVHAWFAERGALLSDETFRKLLKGPPPSLLLSTWQEICETAAVPLSAFVDYKPDGTVRRRPTRRRTVNTAPPAAAQPPVPPRPSDLAGADDG